MTGSIQGNTMTIDPHRNGVLALEAQGAELLVTAGSGQLALLKGQRFLRVDSGRCAG